MEEITNFLIDSIFKDPTLLHELVTHVTLSESAHPMYWNEWFILVIGSAGIDDRLVGIDQLGREIARVYSNWLLIKTAHQIISSRTRLTERIKVLVAEIAYKKRKQKEKFRRKKPNNPNKKTRDNFNRRQRRKAHAHQMKR